MEALAHREDIIVVGTLGKRGERLPEDVAIPANSRIVDYVPYNAILALADVFVFNGGYGGFMHGVMNGVPMVIAGMAADKGEVAARAEWAGIALNMRTNNPTKGAVLEAVDRALSDEKMKARAMEIKEENENMNALEAVEAEIWGCVKRHQ
jgi:UDP:flavonoid glycosyltransferase YjiC (YdhE family)